MTGTVSFTTWVCGTSCVWFTTCVTTCGAHAARVAPAAPNPSSLSACRRLRFFIVPLLSSFIPLWGIEKVTRVRLGMLDRGCLLCTWELRLAASPTSLAAAVRHLTLRQVGCLPNEAIYGKFCIGLYVSR